MKYVFLFLLFSSVSYSYPNVELHNISSYGYGKGIENTITKLQLKNSPEKIKILFYGQSIMKQKWWKLTADSISRQYPEANIEFTNYAIGGYSARYLARTFLHDIYSYYPDLVVFHVYGDHRQYENIIRGIRANTTADILLLTDHVSVDNDFDWNEKMSFEIIPSIAKRYSTGLVYVREEWKKFLNKNNLDANVLLKDAIHLNDFGNNLLSSIVSPYFKKNAVSDNGCGDYITQYEVGKNIFWDENILEVELTGNKIDVYFDSHVNFEVDVKVDGKPPSANPELYYFTRPIAYSENDESWPALLRVESNAVLLEEEWTVKIDELSSDYNYFEFSVYGSISGFVGRGNNQHPFVSNNKEVIIDNNDWNIKRFYGGADFSLAKGGEIVWFSKKLHADKISVKSDSLAPQIKKITIAQGLNNSSHRLQLRKISKNAHINKVVVYSPPAKVNFLESLLIDFSPFNIVDALVKPMSCY